MCVVASGRNASSIQLNVEFGSFNPVHQERCLGDIYRVVDHSIEQPAPSSEYHDVEPDYDTEKNMKWVNVIIISYCNFLLLNTETFTVNLGVRSISVRRAPAYQHYY